MANPKIWIKGEILTKKCRDLQMNDTNKRAYAKLIKTF